VLVRTSENGKHFSHTRARVFDETTNYVRIQQFTYCFIGTVTFIYFRFVFFPPRHYCTRFTEQTHISQRYLHRDVWLLSGGETTASVTHISVVTFFSLYKHFSITLTFLFFLYQYKIVLNVLLIVYRFSCLSCTLQVGIFFVFKAYDKRKRVFKI